MLRFKIAPSIDRDCLLSTSTIGYIHDVIKGLSFGLKITAMLDSPPQSPDRMIGQLETGFQFVEPEIG